MALNEMIDSLIREALDEKKQHMSVEQLHRIEARIRDRIAAARPTLGQVLVIVVPLRVYIALHRRFDRGDANVYTGMANGADRPVRRDALNGAIYAEALNDGREVLPRELIEILASQDLHLPLPPLRLRPMSSSLALDYQRRVRNAVCFLVNYWAGSASQKLYANIIELADTDLIKIGDDSHRNTFEEIVATEKRSPMSFVWTRFSDGDHLCWPAKEIRIRIDFDGEIDVLSNPQNVPNLILDSIRRYLER